MVFKFLTVKPIFPHFFAQTCYKQSPACSLSQDTKCLRKPLCFEGEIQNKTYCHKSNIHCSRKSPGTPLHELTGLGRLVVVVHGQDIFFFNLFLSALSLEHMFLKLIYLSHPWEPALLLCGCCQRQDFLFLEFSVWVSLRGIYRKCRFIYTISLRVSSKVTGKAHLKKVSVDIPSFETFAV